jgi:hypothetical protein
MPNMRVRIGLSVLIALTASILCWIQLERRAQLAADFNFAWRAAWYLLDGQNPYTAIQPAGDYPFQTYFYYPLTAAIAAIPFAWLPPYIGGAVFFGVSSGLLGYALLQDGWKRLPLFLSAPYWIAMSVAQWSPLIAAAALLPGLQWLLVCKPNIGLAGFTYRPTRLGLFGMGTFLLVSLLWLPTWPIDWIRLTRELKGHPPPFLVLPLGPLLLLALLRIRKPAGRLFLGLSLLPQLLFFYDQLLLGLIPNRTKSGLIYSGLSWAAYLGWRLVTSLNPGLQVQPALFVIALIYIPALVFLLGENSRKA